MDQDDASAFARWARRATPGAADRRTPGAADRRGASTVSAVLRHGTFGLGALTGSGDRIVVIDRRCHRVRADGTAVEARPSDEAAFAVVTTFSPDVVVGVDGPASRAELERRIDDVLPAGDFVVAVRVDGVFRHVRAGAEHDVTGTLVGFRMPADHAAAGGHHLDFIDTDRTSGGHLEDVELQRGRIELSLSTGVQFSPFGRRGRG